MKRTRIGQAWRVAGTAFLLLAARQTAWAQATWEGPTGVFLNPLASTLGKGQVQASAHYLELDSLGNLASAGVSYGITPTLEAGVTRAHLAVGTGTNIDLFHAKWTAFQPAAGSILPAVAVGTIWRDAHKGSDTNDYYLAATKVVPLKVPVVVGVTLRDTNGVGSGLFGKATRRTAELGGVLAFVLAKGKLIVGAEYYEQPTVSAWKDLAVRWNVRPGTFIDGGIANLNETLDNQYAVALTHQW